MNKLITVLVLLSITSIAQADIINCSFTEPFYSTQYSMVQQSLKIQDYEGNVRVIKNVSFQIMGRGHFELWDANRNVLQVLRLNFQGTDGMSDNVYPYTVRSSSAVYNSGANYGWGGCSSNFLHIENNN